ncbi:MAG: prepilin-type N-terminal cleavage/methylation domain-containing protein [Planctomycetota bacterium]|jgi:prepilin-type N-terminal cleavage/methylation domain-containing protein
MRKAFTLVEILIVVGIIGILAAIVIPNFQSHSQKTKEVTAKQNLRVARQQLELYISQNAINEMGIDDWPENPFNHLTTCNGIVIGPMPTEATGEYGWILYWPTKTLKLDWPGTDSENISYFDY